MKIAVRFCWILFFFQLPVFLMADQQKMQSESIVVSNYEQSASGGEKGVCGDADNSSSINIGDVTYLFSHIFGGAAPSPYSSGNVNASGRINMADVVYLGDYIGAGGPAPTCSDTVQSSYSTSSGNNVHIGCPPYTPYPGDDSVAIPIYIDNNTELRGISLAFYYPSTDIEITSISSSGSIAPGGTGFQASFDAANNKVLVGWAAMFFPFPNGLSSQTGGLFVTLNARILTGPVDQSITIDTAFYAPCGDYMFVDAGGGGILPEFIPCAPTYLEVTNTNNDGDGSLRWAITEANNNIGVDTIIFSVFGTISPLTLLPVFTDDSTVVLGETAPNGAHSVVIDGTNLGTGSNNGLVLNSNHNVISGLTINKWGGSSIVLNGDANKVLGCYLNMNSDGDTPESLFGGDGILITGDTNIVGGPDASDLNALCAAAAGYLVDISGGKFNKVYNTYFGLTADGLAEIDAGIVHLAVNLRNSADSNNIGDTLGPSNFFVNSVPVVISGGKGNRIANNICGLAANLTDTLYCHQDGVAIISNGIGNIIGPDNFFISLPQDGIFINTDMDSNIVTGNTIYDCGQYGIHVLSNHNLIGPGNYVALNHTSGIYLFSADTNIIIGNTIDGNFWEGIYFEESSSDNLIDSNTVINQNYCGIATQPFGSYLQYCRRNTFSKNVIYNNGIFNPGIDLLEDGVTVNDPGDSDDGCNSLLNYPEIDSVHMNLDSSFTLWGSTEFDSTVIEFFLAHPANDATKPANSTVHGDAYEYIGSDTSNIGGLFEYIIPNTYSQFSLVTMTATDTFGNTSELSTNFSLTPSPLIIVAYSPVNLKVLNPVADSIGKDGAGTYFNTIGDNATYDEIVNDSINIANPILGEYIIIVIPEDDAPPGAIYSIGIRIDGSTQCILVENANVPAAGTTDTLDYFVLEGYHYINGDVNRDTDLNLLDILCLIDCLYGDQGEDQCCPEPREAGDANCDQMLNLIDILYVISNLYDDPAGPEPCNWESFGK